jgi:hypothetical protein
MVGKMAARSKQRRSKVVDVSDMLLKKLEGMQTSIISAQGQEKEDFTQRFFEAISTEKEFALIVLDNRESLTYKDKTGFTVLDHISSYASTEVIRKLIKMMDSDDWIKEHMLEEHSLGEEGDTLGNVIVMSFDIARATLKDRGINSLTFARDIRATARKKNELSLIPHDPT